MKKNIFYYVLSLLMVFSISGCQDDDQQIFDQTPAERRQARQDQLSRLLLASPAFKTVYFPKDSEYGGAQIFFRFTDQGEVFMSSSFDDETVIRESIYEVKFSNSTELVFSTYNHISKLSNNALPGLRGTGFEGASNFIFIDETEEGGIVLEDFRNDSQFTLVPITRAEFDASPAASNQALANKSRLVPGPTTSVFKQLIVTNSSGVENFDLNYDAVRYYGLAEGRNDVGAIDQTIEFGIAFTPTGLTVSPSISIGGNTYTDFVYDPANDNFVSTVNGTTAVLGSSNVPAFITNDFQFLQSEGDPATAYRPLTWGDNPLTSQGFRALIDRVNVNLNPRSFSDFQFNPTFASADTGTTCESILFIFYFSNGTRFRADYCFSVARVEDRKIFLTYNGPIGGNGTAREAQMRPLIDFFASEDGLIVTSEGSFRGANNNFSNLSGTYTSVSNPSQRVYFLKF